jgi:GrpB-like predicted nucleotidyltransferase (UPF0157 family)
MIASRGLFTGATLPTHLVARSKPFRQNVRLNPISNRMRLLLPVEYQSRLHLRFVQLHDRIKQLLPNSSIEHVGSSSIPGALSKGDLDVCVLVQPNEHLDAIRRLTEVGYVEKIETLRTEQLCMLEWHVCDEEHAIQLVAQGSSFEMFMTFRDALISDPSLVAKYNQVKLEAAKNADGKYREAKSLFIEAVLRDFTREIT